VSPFVGGYSQRDAHDVLARVAQFYRVTVEKLLGPHRHRAVARPRMIAMLLLHERGMSLHAIGRAVRRDHSTVVHGVGLVKRACETDGELCAEVERLRNPTVSLMAED
jgi:chromosomal replication initiator protein